MWQTKTMTARTIVIVVFGLFLALLIPSATTKSPWIIIPFVGFCPVSLEAHYVGGVRLTGSDFNDRIGYVTAAVMMAIYLSLGIKAWIKRSVEHAVGLCALAVMCSLVFLLRVAGGTI